MSDDHADRDATAWWPRSRSTGRELHNAFDEALIAELTAAFRALGATMRRCASSCWPARAELLRRRRPRLDEARVARYADEREPRRCARAGAAAAHHRRAAASRRSRCVQRRRLRRRRRARRRLRHRASPREGAQFAFAEVRLGLVPAVISPYVMRAIGPREARRWFLTAERFDADGRARSAWSTRSCRPSALDARASADRRRELLTAARRRRPRPSELIRAGRDDRRRAAASAPRPRSALHRRAPRLGREARKASRPSSEAQAGLDRRAEERMFDRLLIANRGEIACRDHHDRRAARHRARSRCTRRPTRDARHVRLADEACASGRRPRARAISLIDRILEAARAPAPRRSIPATASCRRTPPSPSLRAAGIVFVGPPAAAIRAMGWQATAPRR